MLRGARPSSSGLSLSGILPEPTALAQSTPESSKIPVGGGSAARGQSSSEVPPAPGFRNYPGSGGAQLSPIGASAIEGFARASNQEGPIGIAEPHPTSQDRVRSHSIPAWQALRERHLGPSRSVWFLWHHRFGSTTDPRGTGAWRVGASGPLHRTCGIRVEGIADEYCSISNSIAGSAWNCRPGPHTAGGSRRIRERTPAWRQRKRSARIRELPTQALSACRLEPPGRNSGRARQSTTPIGPRPGSSCQKRAFIASWRMRGSPAW